MRASRLFPVFALCVLPLSAPAAAGVVCGDGRSPMEWMICSDPGIAARDAAMTQLYRAELPWHRAETLAAQRRWLADAHVCRDRPCLEARYDVRNGELLQRDDGRRIARRFHFEAEGSNGDLVVLERSGWITYDATETIIGPAGEGAGDVSAARLYGTARLTGNLARDVRTDGCTALLQRSRDGSWLMEARGCVGGDRANLRLRFRPVR